MKLLCLIFSVMVLLMSARPCCADRDCEDIVNDLKEQATNHAPQEKDCASCSPFFACGSCTGFIAIKAIVQITCLFAERPKLSYSPYMPPHLEKITLSIWQPPQLS